MDPDPDPYWPSSGSTGSGSVKNKYGSETLLFLVLVNNIFASTSLARENFVKIGFCAKEKNRSDYQETHLPPPVAWRPVGKQRWLRPNVPRRRDS